MRSRTYLFFALLPSPTGRSGNPTVHTKPPSDSPEGACDKRLDPPHWIHHRLERLNHEKPDHNCAQGRRGRLGPEKRRRGPHTSSCSMVITTALQTRPTVRRWTHAQPPSRPQP